MKICIWRYLDNVRSFPGYHLSADAEGCRELRDRLGRIHEYEKVTFALTPPDVHVLSVPGNPKAKHFGGRKLRVLTIASLSPNTLRWEEQDSIFILTCSGDQIERILAGVADIEQGKGDYNIRGDDGQALCKAGMRMVIRQPGIAGSPATEDGIRGFFEASGRLPFRIDGHTA